MPEVISDQNAASAPIQGNMPTWPPTNCNVTRRLAEALGRPICLKPGSLLKDS